MPSELAVAIDAGATVIGVNNRNLRTLAVDVHASESLVAMMPKDVVPVSESGLKSAADLSRLSKLGYGAFLIGERFMTDPDPGAALARLLDGVVMFVKICGITRAGRRGRGGRVRSIRDRVHFLGPGAAVTSTRSGRVRSCGRCRRS